MAEQPTHLVVGHVGRPHGTQGEVYVSPLTDHPESVFAPGVVLRAAAEEGESPDPDFPPLRVESVRPFRTGYLIRFGGVLSRNDAEHLLRRYLVLPVEQLEELAEGELFYHQLLGMRVRTLDGTEVGEVQEVFDLEPAPMLELRARGRTLLIPMTERIVREVNAEEGWMVIDPPEGLLDL
jgi:16S rRNA processing protein RimM